MNHTVLVIEDNEEIRGNIREILELSNYTVLLANDGKEGLKLALKNNPDIILCDIMMPDLDGYGVLRGLNNNPKLSHTPFIFVTAKSEKQDMRKGMDLGADDYLTKPFSGNELLSLIETRLRKAEHLKDELENDSSGVGELLNSSFTVENLKRLSDNFQTKKVRKKDSIFSEGDSAKNLYYIISGKIKTYRTNEQGKEYITHIYKENEFFGYSSLLESNSYLESATAIENSEIIILAKQNFYKILHSNTELHKKFIRFITSDLAESDDKLVQLAYNSARKRVAEAIVYLGKKYSDILSENLLFPVCRDDISAISGVSPESVSRNLTDLRTEKLIELINGKIKILNPQKLMELKN